MTSVKSLLFCLLIPAVAAAQSTDSLDQRGRSLIAAGVGLTGSHTAFAGGGKATAQATGQVASLAFTHFVSPQLAIELSSSVLEGNTYAAAGRARDEAYIPFLFGLSYSPAELAVGATLRPYLSLAAGPYIHAVSDVAIGSVKSSAETALGARAGLGANWYLARHFALQLEGDYHRVGKYESATVPAHDPSGFTLSFGVAVAWGR